jgi:hypothetical protein
MKTLLELFAKYQWLEERIGRGLPCPVSDSRPVATAGRLMYGWCPLELPDQAAGSAQVGRFARNAPSPFCPRAYHHEGTILANYTPESRHDHRGLPECRLD